MCGICGIVDFHGKLELKPALEKMSDQLYHRGPDDGDVQLYPPREGSSVRAGLGHRRLAIIDLSPAGRQPMAGPAPDVAVVFNGEIYNFQEKRAECSGYPYRSRTDTEVILALYEKYGEAFVEHLDGMFALALWDGRQEKLLLARDRDGSVSRGENHRTSDRTHDAPPASPVVRASVLAGSRYREQRRAGALPEVHQLTRSL